MSGHALEEIGAILDRGGDPDDVLRAAVEALVASPAISWAGVRFLEEGQLVLGPSRGTPDEARRSTIPIVYRGDPVGELVVDGEAEPGVLERVAQLVAAHVLLGWDTRGEPWEP